jgi:hypothetical protein
VTSGADLTFAPASPRVRNAHVKSKSSTSSNDLRVVFWFYHAQKSMPQRAADVGVGQRVAPPLPAIATMRATRYLLG